jgi:hypothetical protein
MKFEFCRLYYMTEHLGPSKSRVVADLRLGGGGTHRRAAPAREAVMTVRLKPVHDEVVVIIGASSGMGRETALR